MLLSTLRCLDRIQKPPQLQGLRFTSSRECEHTMVKLLFLKKWLNIQNFSFAHICFVFFSNLIIGGINISINLQDPAVDGYIFLFCFCFFVVVENRNNKNIYPWISDNSKRAKDGVFVERASARTTFSMDFGIRIGMPRGLSSSMTKWKYIIAQG